MSSIKSVPFYQIKIMATDSLKMNFQLLQEQKKKRLLQNSQNKASSKPDNDVSTIDKTKLPDENYAEDDDEDNLNLTVRYYK